MKHRPSWERTPAETAAEHAEASRLIQIAGPSGMAITCGRCGKAASIEAWTTRPITGDLPRGQFQCPGCGWAFKRVAVGHDRTLTAPNGNTIDVPERIELRPVQGVM